MKDKLLLTAFIACLTGLVAQSQDTSKIGYANVEYILSKMPEMKKIKVDMEASNTQLQEQLQSMYSEYEQKLQAYEQSKATLIVAVRQEKETELIQLQQRIQNFQTEARNTLDEKQAELIQPLYKKVLYTIETLAKEEGFSHIINGQIGGLDVILFADKKFDVSDKILQKIEADGLIKE